MSHQANDSMDPLKALRDELAGMTPSPQFAARVRQQIDAGGETRAPWLSGWRWLVPVAAAAAVVIAASIWSSPGPGVVDAVITRAPIETPIVGSAAIVSPPAGPTAETSLASARVRTVTGKVALEHPSTRRPVGPVEPVLEVITNQPAILRALWSRVAADVTLVELTPEVLPDTVPEIVVNPIEVSPIVIKWLGDPETAPGTSIIRKVAAGRAERSAQ